MDPSTNVPVPALANLRVVELAVWVAGPAVGGILADWGADVVKVEPPGGDPMRAAFQAFGVDKVGSNPGFTLDNRGKRSVVLDLKEPDAREAFERLLASADVFVTNLRLDALERIGLASEPVTERHPHLIYCSVSGYGLTGPDRNRPGYDIGPFWARSGLSYQLSKPDEDPLNVRGGIGDHITGLAALGGVLAAVLEQRRTGKGCVVDASLLRTGIYCLGWDLGLQMTLGKVRRSDPRASTQSPLMNSFVTSDDHWFFLMGLEGFRHLGSVCRAIDAPRLIDDERFSTPQALRVNRRDLIEILDAAFAARTLSHWEARFEAEDVWWQPVHSPAEVLVDPQVTTTGGIIAVDPGLGEQAEPSINNPINFGGRRLTTTRPAPALGEHTKEILEELERLSAR